jgi:ferredoxin
MKIGSNGVLESWSIDQYHHSTTPSLHYSNLHGGIMKITIDRTRCEGYAKCLQASPKVFKLDAKMIAEVIDPKADTDEKILLAAKICPTKAISLEEEGTGKKIFPTE